MRTFTLPQIRVDDELRASVESVLHEGETLTSFIEETMRRAVEHRLVEREFSRRGEKAWENFQRTGAAHPSNEVFDRIQMRIDVRRKQLARE